MTMKHASNAILAAVLGTAAIARAQPAPGDPPRPDGAAGNPRAAPAPSPQSPYGPDPGQPGQPGQVVTQPDGSVELTPGAPAPRPPRVHKMRFPEVLNTPTGWLLPAGVLYSRNRIDTGGGVSSDNRVGLGDVAEFGIATTDQVHERQTDSSKEKSEVLQPYVTASFRLGVDENRLFKGQPGVTLGFRKSFEREHLGAKTRIAELTLVASKHLGPDVALHLGGALWDASLQENAGAAMPPDPITLHGQGFAKQLRAFGGFEARPLPRSEILVDLSWAPEFCYGCASAAGGPAGGMGTIRLKPELAWGVRYQVARFMHIESGVRVPDIGNANLLDAQIFGQITLTSFALSDAVETLK
jgi:hypothetical protein